MPADSQKCKKCAFCRLGTKPLVGLSDAYVSYFIIMYVFKNNTFGTCPQSTEDKRSSRRLILTRGTRPLLLLIHLTLPPSHAAARHRRMPPLSPLLSLAAVVAAAASSSSVVRNTPPLSPRPEMRGGGKDCHIRLFFIPMITANASTAADFGVATSDAAAGTTGTSWASSGRPACTATDGDQVRSK